MKLEVPKFQQGKWDNQEVKNEKQSKNEISIEITENDEFNVFIE